MKLFPIAFVLLMAVSCGMAISAESAAGKGGEGPPPNIVIIVADDLGFSDIGCYGGEIRTPNLDRLAANGLRFTQFYNTARCWPTRSGILTGYYPQQIRMDPPHGRLLQWTRVLPHYLKPLGYRCYHSGKWHLSGAPKAVADGGFDHSYKLDDHDRYFCPRNHLEDDRPLPPVKPDSGFYVTTYIADHAIRCLKEHAGTHGDKPFFSYVAFTSPHFPLHALQADIDSYRDRYLEGWNAVGDGRWKRLQESGIARGTRAVPDAALTPRYLRPELPAKIGSGEVLRAVAWSGLTPEQKRFQATKMAIHAAMVDRMDQEIGRLLGQIRAMKAWENTLIFFLSDNGADATLLVRGDGHSQTAAPGSAETFLCLGPGWATASNTPFRRHKIWVSEGGISTPLIVHWPKGISARGELRHDMGHVIDFVPTLMELAGGHITDTWNGATAPPLPGRSLVPAFARDNTVQRPLLFFKHEGNRSIRMGDWKLVSAQEDNNIWELFDLATDRGETTNLAARFPDRVREMEAAWKRLDEEYRQQSETP